MRSHNISEVQSASDHVPQEDKIEEYHVEIVEEWLFFKNVS